MPRPKSPAETQYAKEWLGRLKVVMDELGVKKLHLARALELGQSPISQWWRRSSLPIGYHALRVPLAIFKLTGTWVNGHWLATGMGNPYYRAEERESASEARRLGGLSALARVEITMNELRRELAPTSPGADTEPGRATIELAGAAERAAREERDRHRRGKPPEAPLAPRRRKRPR